MWDVHPGGSQTHQVVSRASRRRHRRSQNGGSHARRAGLEHWSCQDWNSPQRARLAAKVSERVARAASLRALPPLRVGFAAAEGV
jgi:hypothetical protein